MEWHQQQKKIFGLLMVGLIGIGTYNAVVINSGTSIDTHMTFAKRVDEVYGIVTPGRHIATTTTWKKLPQAVGIKKKHHTVAKTNTTTEPKSNQEAPAAIESDLDLNLIEVVNAKKWANGVNQFSGHLTTSNGTIENLSVSLPEGDGLSVSFSDMSGNVFEYDMNGEVFSGMLYQVDQSTYMVSLTNGPLEGTRLKFSQSAPAEQETEQSVDGAAVAANQTEFQNVSFQF